MEGDSKPKLFLKSPYSLSFPDFSPDGRWIAYVSEESGTLEVYVQPYPGPGEKIRISTAGGYAPVWGHDQRELFYLRTADSMIQMMVVEIESATSFRAGTPRLLFEGQYRTTVPFRNYDIAPDGQRFIMTTRSGPPEPPTTQMHVILNWAEELKRLVPTN
jgi:Tol biopolymer transport system component